MKKISSIYNWKRLTPDDGHYFFGYYDRNPWNADQSLHLMMKIDRHESGKWLQKAVRTRQMISI